MRKFDRIFVLLRIPVVSIGNEYRGKTEFDGLADCGSSGPADEYVAREKRFGGIFYVGQGSYGKAFLCGMAGCLLEIARSRLVQQLKFLR